MSLQTLATLPFFQKEALALGAVKYIVPNILYFVWYSFYETNPSVCTGKPEYMLALASLPDMFMVSDMFTLTSNDRADPIIGSIMRILSFSLFLYSIVFDFVSLLFVGSSTYAFCSS